MDRKLTDQERQVIRDYRKGRISVVGAAKALGTTRYHAQRLLIRAGVTLRGRFEEMIARYAREGRGTNPLLTRAAIDDVVAAYQRGDIPTQLEAASRLGIQQPSFRRILIERGITPRSRTEVNRVLAEHQRHKTETTHSRPEAASASRRRTRRKVHSSYEDTNLIFDIDELKREQPDLFDN